MVDCRGRGIHAAVTGLLGSVEEREHLSVASVSRAESEEDAVLGTAQNFQADDVLVESLHRFQVLDSQRDLAKGRDRSSRLFHGSPATAVRLGRFANPDYHFRTGTLWLQ